MKLLKGSLQRHPGGAWTFRSAEDAAGIYYTNNNGDGLFRQDVRTGDVKQIEGTCQFSACATYSGMLRKCKRCLDHLTRTADGRFYKD